MCGRGRFREASSRGGWSGWWQTRRNSGGAKRITASARSPLNGRGAGDGNGGGQRGSGDFFVVVSIVTRPNFPQFWNQKLQELGGQDYESGNNKMKYSTVAPRIKKREIKKLSIRKCAYPELRRYGPAVEEKNSRGIIPDVRKQPLTSLVFP